MTKDREFKKLVRERMAPTGQTYQSARRSLVARVDRDEDLKQFASAQEYFGRWLHHIVRWQEEGGPWVPYNGPVPVEDLQATALRHPSPKVRRDSLGALDHEAADASAGVFRRALADPVPRVRMTALHGLACERCRTEELCLPDVVPTLLAVLSGDESPKVRHSAALVLSRLVGRDRTVRPALLVAADTDPDELVRIVSRAAATGDRRLLKSRKALRRRQRSVEDPDGG